MTTTTNVKQVKLNVMTQAQYNSATKNPTELYMITDAPGTAVDSALSTTSENPVQNKVVTNALNGKQDTLVSGTNIRTVGGNSLLGSGNIELPSVEEFTAAEVDTLWNSVTPST